MSDEEAWRSIQRGRSGQELQEASLVLTAVGIKHEILQEEFDFSLRVPEFQAADAVAQLEKYRLENRPRIAPPQPQEVDAGWVGVLGFLGVLWLLPTLQVNQVFQWDWLAAGRMDAGLVVVEIFVIGD